MLRNLLLPLALLLFAGTAHAGDQPLYAPVPAWVKPYGPIDATKLTDEDPMILRMDQQHRLQDAEDWAYAEIAYRLVTPQLLTQLGTIQLPWDPAKGDLIVHQLEIVRGAEHIDLLKAGQRFSVLRREQQLEQASFNGLLTATLAVEGLRVGDVLHLVASTTRKDPALHGHLQATAGLISQPAPLQKGRVRLIWPKALDLRWKNYSGKQPAVADLPAGWRELIIDLPLEKPIDLPTDVPTRFRPLPLLEATSYADWASVSKDMAVHFRTEDVIAPNGPIAAEVAKIAAASSDPRVRTAMAIRLVQDEVRYLFRGMDDGNYVPQKPEQTWSLRYGDCKAKTLLLLAMLRALGIEAEAVLANVGAGEIIPVRLPAPSAFNHVLVRATIGGKTLWLDGTGSGTRLADLDDTPALRWVLPLRAAGAQPLEVPMHADARPASDADVEIDSSAGIQLPSTFKIRLTLRGQAAEMLRLMSSQGGKEASDQMIDNMLTSYVDNAQIVERTVTYDKEAGATLVTASGIAFPDWTKDGGRYKLSLDQIVDSITFAPDRSRPIWSDLPVAAGDALTWRVVRRIRLPGGGKDFVIEGAQALPPILAGNAVRRSARLENGVLTVDQWMASGLSEVAVADIPAVREQVALAKARPVRIGAPLDSPARWRQVAAARAAKAFEPALAIFAKRIAAEPTKAQPWLGRATFLETIYDLPGAIRDLDKAIAIDPSSDNYAWRARLWRNTGDDKRAIADLNAARKIDPGATTTLYSLAVLRARNGESDAALAMVAEQIAAGGKAKNDFVELQATLLGDAGKVDEGLAALDGAIAGSPGNPSLLNSRCWLKGTRNVKLDTALKDCTKAIELSDNPAAALDSRGFVYFRMNRFEDALADFNAAIETNPDQSASLFMRGIIKTRTDDAKGAAEDLSAARAIDPQVDADYARWGVKP
jgi:tetratricopeptide (TPR) repeat protein